MSRNYWRTNNRRPAFLPTDHSDRGNYDDYYYDTWEEEARRRGLDPDDAYDVCRDYHGDILDAQNDR